MPTAKKPKSEHDYYPGYEDYSKRGRATIDAFNKHMAPTWKKAGVKVGTPEYTKAYNEAADKALSAAAKTDRKSNRKEK